jgi:hypothetical protein
MWVSREDEKKKAFDRREWISVMSGAKARCNKRAVLQRIRRG